MHFDIDLVAPEALAPTTSESKDVKRFGLVSLGLVLQATGLKMLLIDDPDALAKVQPMFEERDAKNVRLNNDCRKNKGRRTPKKSSYTPRGGSAEIRSR